MPDAYAAAPFNLSVVRGKYGDPDHARWDSEHDPQNPQPMLYRDWWVIRISVAEVPNELTSPPPGNVKFEFETVHAPYTDVYAHSEILTKKKGVAVDRKGKFNDRVLATYKTALADKSVAVLLPEQVEPEEIGPLGTLPTE